MKSVQPRSLSLLVITLLTILMPTSVGAQSWGGSEDVSDAAVVTIDPPNNYADGLQAECGTDIALAVTLRNTGKDLWDSDVFLAAKGGSDPFRTDADPRIPLPGKVAPGESVTVTVPLTLPTGVQMTGNSDWRLVRETATGDEWFGETAVKTIRVVCQLDGKDDAELLSHTLPGTMECGSTQKVAVTMKNTGTTVWSRDLLMRLGDPGNQDPFAISHRINLPHFLQVQPGDSYTFEFDLLAPEVAGLYTTDWRMIHEWIGYFGDTARRTVNVICQMSETDAAEVFSHTLPTTMSCGETRAVTATFTNTGTSIWRADDRYALGAVGDSDLLSTAARVQLPPGVEIAPKQTYTFDFEVTAPSGAGLMTTEWRMVHDGFRWFGDTAQASVQIECAEFGVLFSQPREQAVDDGEVFEWGILYEDQAPAPFRFTIAGPDGPEQQVSNLRVVSVEGPVTVDLGTFNATEVISAQQGLVIDGSLGIDPAAPSPYIDNKAPFRVVLAFDHDLDPGTDGTYQFEIAGEVHPEGNVDNDNWSFVFEDYGGPFVEVIPEEQLPRQLTFRGRIDNNDTVESLRIALPGGISFIDTPPFGITTELEAFGGPEVVIPPGGDYTFRILINAGIFAESGQYRVDVSVSPTNSSVTDLLTIQGEFDIQGPDLSLDNVSVRLLSSPISVGNLGTLTIDPVEGPINIDFQIDNFNNGDIHINSLSATIAGPAAAGLTYNPFPTSGVVSPEFPSIFGGQLQILSTAIPGDFTINVAFNVTDGDSPPDFNELFSFYIEGTLATCGGGGNCGPVVSLKDSNGNDVRGTHRLNLSNEGTHDLLFRISNIGDEDLVISPPLGLSGHSRFSVVAQPSPTNLPPGGAQTSNFTLRFNAAGTGIGDVFATNVTINSNAANSPTQFRLEVTTRPPIPLIVEVIDFVVADGVVDLGTNDHLPLLPVIRITNPTSDHYYIKSFRSLQSRGGPLEWNWTSSVPESSENSAAVRIDKDGGVFHAGGEIDLNGDPGDVNKPYTFNFSFEYDDSQYSALYTTYRLDIVGDLDGVYNPNITGPEIDCEHPDNVCVSNYCGAVQQIFHDQPLPAVFCVASALSAYWGCLGCGASNPGCWGVCLVGIIGSLGCGLVVDDFVDDLRQAVINTRTCYCNTSGEFCEESYFIGWEVLNQPIATTVDVHAQCQTSQGLDIRRSETVSLSNSYGFDLLRCPKDAFYQVRTDPVQVPGGGPGYKCTLVDPPGPSGNPTVPQYGGVLMDHFPGRFDCTCADPAGCGQLYTLLGTAEGVQPGEAVEVLVNLLDDSFPQPISVTTTVTQNGQFQFIAPVPAAAAYTVTVVNKQDYPHCAVEPTGNPIGGPGNVVDVVRLTCDSTRPNVRIIVPMDGETVQPGPGGLIPVIAVAGDTSGIRNVVFYEDGGAFAVATSTSSQFQVDWVPNGTGPRTLLAFAMSNAGGTEFSDPITVNVGGSVACDFDTQPPTIQWVDPDAGDMVPQGLGGSLLLEANVTDDTGMNHVDFYLDGNKVTVFNPGPLYLFTAPQVGLGPHTLRVVAADTCGKESETPQYSFTVIQGDPNLADGALLSADCSSLYGWAQDTNHTNKIMVEFYRGGARGTGTFVGQALADDPCTGLPGDPNNCFVVSTPAALKTGLPETVYVHARDIDTQGQPTGAWPELALSPQTLVCTGGGGNPPPIPSGVTASNGTFPDRVRVGWNTSNGATSYEVYRNTVNNSGSATMIQPGNSTTTYDDMGVTAGSTYYYWIKAKNADGTSNFSTVASGWATGGTTNDHLPEGNLDAADCTHIAGWVRDADYTGRTQAHIYRDGPAGGGGTVVATIWADLFRGDLPYPDKYHGFDWSVPAGSIPHNTPIYVYGLNVDSNGDFDGPNQLMNGSPRSFNCPGATPPEIPTGVVATDGTYPDKVRITWNTSDRATSYSVWRHTANNAAQATNIQGSIGGTLFDDSTVTPGVTYYYWVRAHNTAGASGFSLVNSGYADDSPTNNHLPEGNLDAADCNHIAGWVRDADYTGRTQAHIYRDGPYGAGGTIVAVVWADLFRGDLPYPDKNHGFDWPVPAGSIPHNTPIYVYGQNVDSTGGFNGPGQLLNDSPRSFNCPGATPPDIPTGVVATDGTYPDKVRITWNTSNGATSYSVWRHTANNAAQATNIQGSIGGTLFDDSTVTPGVTYYYWVRAHNTAGVSGFSLVNSGYADNTPVNNHLPEGTLDAADCNHIAGWVRDADYTGRTQAHIYRDGPYGGGGTIVAVVWADLFRGDLPYPDKNHGFDWPVPAGSIPHGTPIYVYGQNVDSTGGFNGPGQLLASSPRSFNCPGATPPDIPTGVVATDGTYPDKVRITWNTSNGATSYSVWRHTSNSSAQATNIQGSIGGTLFDDSTVTPGVTYYYWVRAHNAAGTSGFSLVNSGYAGGPAVNNYLPEGTLDVANCTHIAGWARDADNTGRIQVHIFRDGPYPAGTVVATIWADLFRGDLPYPDKDHGFDWQVPAGSIPAGTQIYVYGINVDSAGNMNGNNPLLSLSPRPLTCP